MMDTFAQVLDEAFFGLKADDSIAASFHMEAIKELIDEFERGQEADLIPEEVRTW